MRSDYILKADILDIIFENRNKDYGAYALRKYYHERVYKALGVILIVTLIFGVLGILYKNKVTIGRVIPEIFCGPPASMPVDEPKVPEPLRPAQKKVASAAPVSSVMDQVPVITDNNNSVKLNPPGDAGPISSPDGPATNDTPPGAAGGGETVSSIPPIPPPAKIDPANPMRSAEIIPSFPGGIEALKKFLKKNLVSQKELEPGEIISVTIQFVVGYDGILKGFEITEDGGEAFNNEVIRVIKKMPVWLPGKSHGENVSVYYSIPVKFAPTE